MRKRNSTDPDLNRLRAALAHLPGYLELLLEFPLRPILNAHHRFLLTELVPLQLILEHRGTVVSLSQDGATGKDGRVSSTTEDEIPF